MRNEAISDGAGQYEIRLKGHLQPRWASWFDGLDVANQTDGTAVISGTVADQSALHGLLQKVRDVGLPLLAVTRVDEPIVDHSASTQAELERN